jgi:hypothetical protein
MEWFRSQLKTKHHHYKWRAAISIRGILSRTRSFKRDNYSTHHKHRKHNRNYLGLLAVALLYGGSAAAQTSSTAAPVANSSGSVTNMGIQNLPGNSVTNHYGGNIICQGPMLTISPFATDSHTYSTPREYWYDAPSYNDDGSLSHHVATRTGQKDNFALNLGISANFSIPLDNSLQKRCKAAVDKQLALQQELVYFKRLDFEITRLKNCGELKLAGIEFSPTSSYHKICSDILVMPKMGQVLPHRHTLTPLEVVTPSSPDKN